MGDKCFVYDNQVYALNFRLSATVGVVLFAVGAVLEYGIIVPFFFVCSLCSCAH